MTAECLEIVQALLAVPEAEPIPEDSPLPGQLVLLADRLSAWEPLFLALADASEPRAREVLYRLKNRLTYYHAGLIETLIDQVADDKELDSLAAVPEEELDAHLVIVALLPSEALKTRRRKRVLVRALARRNPMRAADLVLDIKMTCQADKEFWGKLRLELFHHFRDIQPERALCLLDDVSAGHIWFLQLILSNTASGNLCLQVLERLLTIAFPARLTSGQLAGIANRVGHTTHPERVAMLRALIRRVHFPQPAERLSLLRNFLTAAESWTSQERSAIHTIIHKEALHYLLSNERAEALKNLIR